MSNQKWQDKFNQAEVLLGGSREQRKKAQDLLQEIIKEAHGTPIAEKAHDRLLRYSTDSFSEPLEDQKTRQLRSQWIDINSLTHPTLKSFLNNLFEQIKSRRIELARKLFRNEVIAELKQWIKNEIATVQPNENDWITAQVAAVHKHPDFEKALIPALKEWQSMLFQKKYQQQKDEIDAALKNGLIDEAWRLFETLGVPAASLHDDVAILKDKITEVACDIRELDRLLALCVNKKMPETWIEVRQLVAQQLALQQFKSQQFPIPADKQLQIQACLKKFYITAFLTEQAKNCGNLKAVREFWEQYNTPSCLEIPLESSWFDEVIAAYQKYNDTAIKSATSVEVLDNIFNQLQEDKVKLPPFIEKVLTTRIDAIAQLIEIWRTLKMGADFPAQEIESFVIPQTFQNDMARYQKVWVQLDNISQRIHPATDYPTLEDFQWATEQLTIILNDYPKHERALCLQDEIAQGSQQFSFDVALQKWDFENFLNICQQYQAVGKASRTDVKSYLKLAKYEHKLYQLSQLAKAEKFRDMLKANKWWINWKKIRQTLPPLSELPPIFLIKVEQMVAQRQNEWFELSETLLANTHATALDYFEAAHAISLCWYDPVPDFRQYYQEFIHRAWYKETEEYIGAKSWQAAGQSLARFKQSGGADEKEQQLAILLELKQAYANNPGALTNILWERWHGINQYLAPQEISDFLYVAIREHWQNDDQEQLFKLKTLASRLSPEQVSEPLRIWIEWLDIERKLEISPNTPFSKGEDLKGMSEIPFLKGDTIGETIERLAKLVLAPSQKKAALELHQPLEKLNKNVQNWSNSLFFIWFYHATQSIQPSLISRASDPLDKLTQDSKQRVAQIEARLKNHLTESELSAAQDEIKFEQERWLTLEIYFGLLPFQITHKPVKPVLLNDIQDSIAKLLSIQQDIVYLENVDIRKPDHKNKLKRIYGLLTYQLKDYPVQPLLKRITALQSLFSIHSPLNRFYEVGKRCGSDASSDLDTLHLFEQMSDHLKKVIEVFKIAKLIDSKTWQALSKEAWDFAKQEAGVLVDPVTEQDLRNLLNLLKNLDKAENVFRNEIWALGGAVPIAPIGAVNIDCTNYQGFFQKMPLQAPRTRRSYYLFQRVIKVEPGYTILQQCQECVPDWVREVLERIAYE